MLETANWVVPTLPPIESSAHSAHHCPEALRCEGVRSSPWIIGQHAMWSTCIHMSIIGGMIKMIKLSDGRTCLPPALRLQVCFRGRALGTLGLSPHVKRRLWSRHRERKGKRLAQAWHGLFILLGVSNLDIYAPPWDSLSSRVAGSLPLWIQRLSSYYLYVFLLHSISGIMIHNTR